MFVAVGGTSAVANSKDSLSWKRFDDAKGNPMTLNSEIDFGKTHLYGIAFHTGEVRGRHGLRPDLLLAYGRKRILGGSELGQDTGDAYFSVAVGEGTFVAGSKGQFSVSKDGVAWYTRSSISYFPSTAAARMSVCIATESLSGSRSRSRAAREACSRAASSVLLILSAAIAS